MTEYRFNGIRLDSASRRIVGPRGSVHLPPKPYEVLVELLHAACSVVTREALLDRVWPERPASDETLSRTITDLRKLLGDDSRAPRYIETVPKVGYRFLLDVERGDREPEPGPSPRRNRLGALAAALVVLALASAYLLRPDPEPRATVVVGSGILGVPIPLTTEVGDEDTPDFSPDGKQLVYAARDRGDENWDIRLRDLATGEATDLAGGPDREYAPVFSPDGRRVAFLRYRGERCQVVVKALDGGERPVADCQTPLMAYLDWSPDGRRIAFSQVPAQGGATLALRTVDLETRAIAAPVAAPPDGEYQFAPKFSPDGRQLAYVQGVLDRNELWLADLPSGRARPITAFGGRITGASWDGAGTGLYVATAAPAEPALWRVVPGRPAERLRGGEAFAIAFDHVHRRLVFDNIRPRTNIWSTRIGADGDADAPVRAVASTRIDFRPSVSPDGRRLAFVSDRTGHYEVWLADATGDAQRRLTQWQAADISRPAWSPDGRTLAYAVLRDGRWTGFLDPMDGTVRQRIPVEGQFRHPTWSPDGRWVLHADEQGIRRVSPGQWRVERVLDQAGAVPLFVRDQAVYFLQPGRPGIQRLPSQGPPDTLLAEHELVVPEAISSGGGHLYFIGSTPQDGIRRLFAHDMDSGGTRAILPLVAYARHAHTTATLDGATVYFSQTDDAESDLVVIDAPP
ncbi:winged helix-turn-helix domain-containing protein [Luteimonas vadosa]|uniref:OmpR/PhoB-type domain-containing protein n=1 Tax=Luteimonas vadosa TaxID=1165507 RepID=A0ABP9DVU2_9GAMM